MMKRKFCLIIIFLLLACAKTGLFNTQKKIKIPRRDNSPCNPNAARNTRAVLKYIADLSAGTFKGVIVGQNCGHTADIYNVNHIMSYSRLVKGLHGKTGKWVGILGVDYEHDRIYTLQEISQANQILTRYWKSGGLVAIGFSPINPWLNDESNLKKNPGLWVDTRTNKLSRMQLNAIDLKKLVNPKTKIYHIWHRKLDRIAAGLWELQKAGVVVLFKPMQEQNGFWFWWGVKSHMNDPSPYIDLYRDMFNYFTYKKGLNNLLWMYSPNKNARNLPAGIKSQMWVYPGDDYVDIIAPTSYNSYGNIFDYEELLKTGKPLGMAEFGPDHAGNYGNFDNRTYIRRISRHYTEIAFWISWHDWHNGNGTDTYMSIFGNKNAHELMNHKMVITRNELAWKKYLR